MKAVDAALESTPSGQCSASGSSVVPHGWCVKVRSHLKAGTIVLSVAVPNLSVTMSAPRP